MATAASAGVSGWCPATGERWCSSAMAGRWAGGGDWSSLWVGSAMPGRWAGGGDWSPLWVGSARFGGMLECCSGGSDVECPCLKNCAPALYEGFQPAHCRYRLSVAAVA
jgi:hypothetical protein